MNKEEKKSIEIFNLLENYLTNCKMCQDKECQCDIIKARNTILSLVKKQNLIIHEMAKNISIRSTKNMETFKTAKEWEKIFERRVNNLYEDKNN